MATDPAGPDFPHAGQLAQLFGALQAIERELGLLDRQVSGVNYWPLIRAVMLDNLSRRLGLLELPAMPLPRRAMRQLAPALTHRTHSPWPVPGRFDTVVAPFPRKHLRDGRRVDVIAERAISDTDLGRILVLEWGDAALVASGEPAAVVRSASYHRALAGLRAAPRLALLLGEVAAERAKLDGALWSAFGIGCPLSDAHIALRVAFFAQGRELARRFLRASGAGRLIFAGGHAVSGLVAAARDCGMTTVELQHGAITRLHPVYHFDGRPRVPYAPDVLLTFGSFWQTAADLPAGTRTAVVGSANVSRMRAGQGARAPGTVLVVSQRTIGPRLFADAVAIAREAPQWRFIFLAHPGETASDYRAVLAAAGGKLDNLRIAAPGEGIYDLIGSSEVQLGVYSTGLFEGMALGLRTIVMAYPGAEHMLPAIEAGDAVLARDSAEAASLLAVAPRCASPSKYYAEPVASIAATLADLRGAARRQPAPVEA